MIKHLKHNEIDPKAWDGCIENAPNGRAYALSWYLDTVHPGWEALVEDNYRSVMPLTAGRKFGIPYLFQPFFAQQLGVFSINVVTVDEVLRFLEAIPDRYRLIEIRLNEDNILPETQPGVDFHRNITLNLDSPYESLHGSYHTNTRRNLAAAVRNDLRIVNNVPIDTIIRLFRANRGARVKIWGDKAYDLLRRLSREMLSHDMAFIQGVTLPNSNEIIAGALFVKWQERIIFLFSGNSALGMEKQAMTFLIDHVIVTFANRPYIFDFEGSDNANLARFYRGFGGSEVLYPSYAIYRLNIVSRTLLGLWKHMKRGM